MGYWQYLSIYPTGVFKVSFEPYLQRVSYTDSRRVSAANFCETSAKHARNVRNVPRNIRETSAKHPRNTAKRLQNACETQRCGAIRRAPQCFGA